MYSKADNIMHLPRIYSRELLIYMVDVLQRISYILQFTDTQFDKTILADT